MPLATKVILIGLVSIGAVYDLRWRRIPNWLTLAGLILALALNTFLFEWQGLKISLLGLGLAFGIYFPLYLLRAMGAGDVKLMMAVGALVGWAAWLVIFILTGIAGGLIAIVVLLWRGRLKKTLWNVSFLVQRLLKLETPYTANEELDVRSGKGLRLPHAASIAVGSGVFLLIGYFTASA